MRWEYEIEKQKPNICFLSIFAKYGMYTQAFPFKGYLIKSVVLMHLT